VESEPPKLEVGSSKDGDDPEHEKLKQPSLFFITALVNEQPLQILIDTGAHESFISTEAVKHLRSRAVRKETRSHWLADGITPFVTNGEVELSVKIGSKQTTVRAAMADTLSCLCILGVDWILANNVSILTHEKRIALFDQEGEETASTTIEMDQVNSKTSNQTIGTFSIRSHGTVRSIIDNLAAHLDDAPQRQQVQNLLVTHEKLFDLTNPTKATPAMFHTIETGCARPTTERARIQSKFQREETKKHVAAMLEAGQIVHSNSPWAAPVHIVRKPDGSTRFTVDYRKLNGTTLKDNYPLPSISETINQLQGNAFYTKLDLKSGYLQIPILERDQAKTAFVTREGLYHFKVLPAGLKNAPPLFQRIMNTVVVQGREHFCLVYLDDIIVFSKSFTDHMGHVREVLAALNSHQFQLNPPKCVFFKPSMNYLGHQIDANGMMPLDDKIDIIKQLPMPTTLREANYFIGALGFYRKFIKGFAQLAAPIHRVTNLHKRQSRDFVWGAEQSNAFRQLKQAISSAPLVLDFPDENSPLILSTDASDIGIGGVLKQATLDGTRIVYYHSQLLNSAQRRYSTIEKEALAVIKCVEKLRPYLLGRDFVIETDHCPLCNFHQRGSKNRRVDNWSLILFEYNIQEVRYKKGNCNCDADLASRYPVGLADMDMSEHCPKTPIRTCINAVTRAAAARNQLTTSTESAASDYQPSSGDRTQDGETRDPNHCDLDSSAGAKDRSGLPCKRSPLDLLRIKQAQSEDKIVRQYLQSPPTGSIIEDGILFQRRHVDGQDKKVPYVPEALVPEVLAAAHDHRFSAHFGRDKTFEKLRSRCFWPGMYSSIQTHVKKCHGCARFNIRRKKPPGHMKPIEPPTDIFHMIGLDFWGPVQESNNGNRYVIVLTDYLSKFVVAKALPNCTAQDAAQFIVETALTFGVPSQILTDNGSHFRNQLFQALSNILGFEHILSTPYHPQSNGQTERWNATMRPKLLTLCQNNEAQWDDFLAGVVHAYNTSSHASTGYSPSFLMFAREIPLAFDAARPVLQLSKVSDYVEHLSRFRKNVLQAAGDNIRKRQRLAKHRHDRHRQDPVYEVGQLVFMKRQGARNKFDERQCGPFRITGTVGHNRLTYLIESDHTPGQYQVHINDLTPC
jgi:transposase InsO family protein